MRRNIWWQVLMDEANPDGGGGGGGNPPVFDHAKFTADSDKRFKAIEKQNTDMLAALTALKPKEPPPEPDPKPGDDKNKPDPKVKALEKQVADLLADNAKEKEATRREKRNTALTTELTKLGVPADRLKSAMRAVDPDIKFSEDGSLVGEDDVPVTDYLANWIKGNDHFLPPRQVGGAGATGGQRGRGEKPPQLEDIKPGMKPEDLQRTKLQISELLKNH